MKKTKNIIAAVAVVLTAIITAGCLLCSPMAIDKKLEINIGMTACAVIIGAVFVSLAVMMLFSGINKLAKKPLIITAIGIFGLFILGEIFVILNFQSVPMTDSARCMSTAMDFANGNITTLAPADSGFEYFKHYSNNNFFVVLLSVFFKILSFFKINDLIFCSYILNAAAIFAGILLLFFAVKRLWGLKKAVKFLTLCVLNPMFYLYVPWIYTITLAMPFMSGIILLLAYIYKAKSMRGRILLSAILGVLCAAAYLLRVTSVFPVIAVFAALILNIRADREYFKKAAVAAVSFILLFAIAFVPLKSFANNRFKDTLKYNFPVTHWVMMGLEKSGRYNKEASAFTSRFETKREKTEQNIKQIKRLLSEYTPLGFAKHTVDKTVRTWGDGTNGVYGRLRNNRSYTSVYRFVYSGRYNVLAVYCQIYRAATLIFILLSLLKLLLLKNRHASRLLPAAITMLGAYVFYMIWEVKSEYGTPFLPIMTLLAAFGADYAVTKLKFMSRQKMRRRFERFSAAAASVLVLATVFCGSAFYAQSSGEGKTVIDPAVNATISGLSADVKVPGKSGNIVQEFYCENPFNTLTVNAFRSDMKNKRKLNKKIVYKLMITDENFKTLWKGTAKSADVKLKNYTVDLGRKIVPKGRSQYYLIIKKLTPVAKNTIKWSQSSLNNISLYDGDLYINGKRKSADLKIKLADIHTFNGWKEGRYYAIAAAVLVSELLITGLLFYSGFKKNNLKRR